MASTPSWKSANSQPAIARSLQSWWCASQPAACCSRNLQFFRMLFGAPPLFRQAEITIFHLRAIGKLDSAHAFFLTVDIVKKHYSYDLITTLGSQPAVVECCSKPSPLCRSVRHSSTASRGHAARANGRALTMRIDRTLCKIMLLLVTLCAAAWAQDTGSITGTV